jgi:AcrR family transcriptional regulator
MATDTRDRLVAEALRLFSERGYAATSVAELERAAGLTPGAGGLYAHFTSKEELLGEAVERAAALTDVGYGMHAALVLGDLRSELTVVARGAFYLFDSMKDLLRLAMREGDLHPGTFADARDRLSGRAYRFLADLLQAKVDAGELQDHDTDAVADVLFGALNNYWVQTALYGWQPNDVSRDEFVAAWVDLALRLAIPTRPTRQRRSSRSR